MKIIYSGGYDKLLHDSESKNVIHRHRDEVKRFISEKKKVAFVTNAKPAGYYDDKLITAIGVGFEIIDDNSKNVNWESYDMLIILGGEQVKLKTAIDNLKFDLSKLKSDTLLIGDSAGAMVLGAWFYDADFVDNSDFKIEFHQGINPNSKNIFLVHSNNPRYVSPALIKLVEEFAAKKDLAMISLPENQEYILDVNGVT